MLNIVNVSPVAVPVLTAHAQCTRSHPLTGMWLGACAERKALPRVAWIDWTRLWPLLHSFFCWLFFSSSLYFFFLSVLCGREMADGPSPRCDIIITNLHN